MTVLLSELSDVEKVRDYYLKSTDLIPEFKKRQEETEDKLRELDEVAKDIPSLL